MDVVEAKPQRNPAKQEQRDDELGGQGIKDALEETTRRAFRHMPPPFMAGVLSIFLLGSRKKALNLRNKTDALPSKKFSLYVHTGSELLLA
jgi:hypothetical protein